MIASRFRAALAPLAAALLFVSVPASASAGADAKTPVSSLSVTPSHVRLAPGAREVIHVTNAGTRPVVVSAVRAGYALDPHGRPRVAAPTGSTLSLRPARFALAPGATAPVTVVAPARHVPPGDHASLVLLEARSPAADRVGVAVRIGIVVDVRAPGTVVRRLDVRALRLRRSGRVRTLELALVNRGNVSEHVGPGRLSVRLLRHGRLLATLRPGGQELLPRTTGLVDVRYRGQARGRVTAVVLLGAASRGGALQRRFQVTL
jgi:hypothetical protein